MRCLIKAEIPSETGNQLLGEGRLPQVLGSILEQLKPEAAYFSLENGNRCAYIFADISDPSQIPGTLEPFFFALNAKLTVTPAMVAEDLKKAGPDIEKASKAFYNARQAAGVR